MRMPRVPRTLTGRRRQGDAAGPAGTADGRRSSPLLRHRVRILYLGLLSGVLLVALLPLGLSVTDRAHQRLHIETAQRTLELADLVGRSTDDDALAGRLREAEREGHVRVLVTDAAGRPSPALPDRGPGPDPVVADAVREALAGGVSRYRPPERLFGYDPVVVAAPVRRDGLVVGAVVTVTQTGTLRAQTLRWWAVLLVVSMAVVAGGWVVSVPFIRWLLRPVHRLDQAAHAIMAGDLHRRVPLSGGPAELDRLVGSFNAMTETVAGVIDRERQFASRASHQLRNPLAALRLRLENLREQSPESLADDCRELIQDVDDLDRICGYLLTLARSGSHVGPRQTIDVADHVARRLQGWHAPDREDVRVRQVGAGSAPAVVPPGTVDQVLDALVDNAAKFGRPGGRIQVGVDVDGHHVALTVTDDGPGLPPQEYALALRPFWRSPTHRAVDGTGLGLAVVHQLVRAADGRLDIGPGPEGGTRVRVLFPAAPTDPARPDQSRRRARADRDSPVRPAPKSEPRPAESSRAGRATEPPHPGPHRRWHA
ncbi:sensor histidine kinase [Micromonospora maritima]|uniref:histidine kinase n=1 Tax=Micromonospora maritima TaxID=986711 RepID=A0ABW7ZJB5_9ACTN